MILFFVIVAATFHVLRLIASGNTHLAILLGGGYILLVSLFLYLAIVALIEKIDRITNKEFSPTERYYRDIRLDSLKILLKIKKHKNLKIGQLQKFSPEKLEPLVSGKNDNKRYTRIFGLSKNPQSFIPSLTKNMLDVQAILEFINASIDTRADAPAQNLEKPLRDVIVHAVYLETVFSYMRHKSRIIKRQSKNIQKRDANLLKQLKRAHMQWGMKALSLHKGPLKVSEQDAMPSHLKINDFSWLGYAPQDDNNLKTVNHYPIPTELFMQYVQERNLSAAPMSNNQKNTAGAELHQLAQGLSPGDISIYTINVGEIDAEHKEFKIGTSTNSAHFKFLKKLEELGLAKEQRDNNISEIPASVTMFVVTRENQAKILDTLKKARPDIFKISSPQTD